MLRRHLADRIGSSTGAVVAACGVAITGVGRETNAAFETLMAYTFEVAGRRWALTGVGHLMRREQFVLAMGRAN
eukprot:6381046-Amphidinium_carterae.1